MHQALVLDNARWLTEGGRLTDRHDDALHVIEVAFDLLDHGLGRL